MDYLQVDHSLDGQSQSGLIIWLSVGFGVASTVLVTARIYRKAIQLRSAGLEDILIIISQIFNIGLIVTTIIAAHFGLGRHIWVLNEANVYRLTQCMFAAMHLFLWSTTCTKISLLFQFRRIFTATWLPRTTIILTIFFLLWNIIQVILTSFGCKPISYLYPSMAHKCLNPYHVWISGSIINVLTDFVVCILPIPLVKTLQLPTRQKILLCMVFAMGLLVCVVSVGRTVAYVVITRPDITWISTVPMSLTMVEANCAVICSCLPMVWSLIRPLIHARKDITKHTDNGTWNSNSRQASVAMKSTSQLRGDRRFSMLQKREQSTDTISAGDAQYQSPCPVDYLESDWANSLKKNGECYHGDSISSHVSAGPESVCSNCPARTGTGSDSMC